MKKYSGSYKFFDFSKVKTYPISERQNKVAVADLADPGKVREHAPAATKEILAVAAAVRKARDAKQPVILFTGAHQVKLGFSPLIIDLLERGLVTHVAGTGATAIHDFELALIGATSEHVPNSLGSGLFGMAEETGGLINRAVAEGFSRGLGFGESVGRLINGEAMPERVKFAHPALSILAAGARLKIPVTIHTGIGTDIIDQHPTFDGCAKGGASGFDFGIFAATVTTFTSGGVVLNVGSAVTGPEVLLKAVSMAANIGKAPKGIITANFDIRNADQSAANDDSKQSYYFRDNKSIVTRIPASFGGKGWYVEGDFRQTIPAFYKALVS